MNYNTFKELIEKEYGKTFNDGIVIVNKFICLGKSISIDVYSEAEETSCVSRDNDCVKFSALISLQKEFNYDEDELPDHMEMRILNSYYLVKPEQKYLCYSVHSIRKIGCAGNANKIVLGFGKIMKRLYSSLEKDFVNDRITEGHHKEALKSMLKIN